MAYFGLYALQHRGQESTGIASYDGKHIRLHAGMGLVPDVYDEATLGQELQGNRAIGHVRYSTSGVSVRKNAQPLVVRVCGIEIALAHNGNLTNASELRGELESEGAIFQTSSDSEIFVHLIARSLAKKKDLEEARTYARTEGGHIKSRHRNHHEMSERPEADGVPRTETCA